jgi:hypothetical protein
MAGVRARAAALGSQAPAQQAIVVGGVVGEGDSVAVDGLDKCQPVLTAQPGVVVGCALNTEMELGVAC